MQQDSKKEGKVDIDSPKYTEKMIEFCNALEIPKSYINLWISDTSFIPRFLRLNPWTNPEKTIQDLQKGWPGQVEMLTWVQGFVSLHQKKQNTTEQSKLDKVEDQDIRIHDLEPVQAGHAWPMDAASGFAVQALGVVPGDHVLDLCCCPGGKLLAIVDALQLQGSLTGVDISMERLNVCRKLVLKHFLSSEEIQKQMESFSLRLFCADGKSFDLLPLQPDEQNSSKEICYTKSSPGDGNSSDATSPKLVYHSHVCTKVQLATRKRKRMNKSARTRESHLLQHFQKEALACRCPESDIHAVTSQPTRECALADRDCSPETNRKVLYDKILVDAECTHDGSFRHMQKLMQGDGSGIKNFFSTERAANICELQKCLLRNGFRLLKPGGVLMYSTCSLSKCQNEQIISWLLKNEFSSKILPVDVPEWHAKCNENIFEEVKLHLSRQTSMPVESSSDLERICAVTSTFLDDALATQKCENDMLVKKYTAYFSIEDGTSGLFIAKISKTNSWDCASG